MVESQRGNPNVEFVRGVYVTVGAYGDFFQCYVLLMIVLRNKGIYRLQIISPERNRCYIIGKYLVYIGVYIHTCFWYCHNCHLNSS